MAGKIVIITGGSQGYGKAMARKFYEQGDKVVIVSRSRTHLDQAAAEIGAIDTFAGDVTQPKMWEQLHNYIMEKYGRIDLLVNNAGGAVSLDQIIDQSIEDIDQCIALNLSAVIYGCRIFGKLMQEQHGGTIINVGSVCSTRAWSGLGTYTAAKFGLRGFSKVLYVELRPFNVRVTCFIPAAGDTDFRAHAKSVNNAIRPMMKAEDVAQGVVDVFNLSDHIVIEEVTMWGIDQVVIPL
jgi:short-subunit dehydrogenase